MRFKHGKSYRIETLPDDLYDAAVPPSAKWAIREVLLWNDCQGWWTGGVSEYLSEANVSGVHVARFWSPLPPSPMTRQEILAERGMVVCPACDIAMDRDKPHSHATAA